jgi:hypothetical protein
MSRKIETIPVQPRGWVSPHPCRVLGRIRNLIVCWAPEAVNYQGNLNESYRARRRYCTIATRTADGHYVPVSQFIMTQWQALRLAIKLANTQVNWAEFQGVFHSISAAYTQLHKLAEQAVHMPDDQRSAEKKRADLFRWIADPHWEDRRDRYYLELVELEEFMGA